MDLAGGLTAELASHFESATKERASHFTIETAVRLGRPVYVDREMWEKIVLNLLSNAFKFTFEGEIVVRIQEGRLRDRSKRINRSGYRRRYTEDQLPRLFERFHRVEGQKSRSFEGSGIGPALVQELVKLPRWHDRGGKCRKVEKARRSK